MHRFNDASMETYVDAEGVLRWQGTDLVVGVVSMRKAGYTDPDMLREQENASLNDFLKDFANRN